jgi:hypothetical protein
MIRYDWLQGQPCVVALEAIGILLKDGKSLSDIARS